MATPIGLPGLTIKFQAAAKSAASRSKKGIVAVFVRDAKAQGLHVLSSAPMIPTDLGADNQAYLQRAFTGSDRGTPSKVAAVVIGTSTGDTSALEAGLKLVETMTVDYIAPPPDLTDGEEAVLVNWVKNRRDLYFTEKVVLANATTPPDYMGAVNFCEEDDTLTDGSKTYTAGEYLSRVAGILAGLPVSMSGTYTVLPELTAVTPRTLEEQEEAVNAGKLILTHDGQQAKIVRAVNSLTTVAPGMGEDWRKIKIVEGLDLISYYLRTTIQNEYVGQYPNTYENKLVLVTAIQSYLTYLEGAGVLNPGESYAEIDLDAQTKWLAEHGVDTSTMTDQEIKEYQTGDWVGISCGGRLLDAMETFSLSVSCL